MSDATKKIRVDRLVPGKALIGFLDFVTPVPTETGAAIWFRGHRQEGWSLSPRVFRPDESKKSEQNLTALFRLQAPALRAQCPDTDTNEGPFDWLCLMRHYGLPTRLLDWSQSALVAAHFAVNGEFDGCSAVWAFMPGALHESQGHERWIQLPGSKITKELARVAFLPNLPSLGNRVVGVIPKALDQRILLQQSRFTIHGDGTPLEKLPSSQKFLKKLLISKECKDELRRALQAFGVRQSSLFGDLSHLADDIRTGELTA